MNNKSSITFGGFILSKPLEFGNTGQIATIKAYRSEMEEKEERERKIECGELTKFRVTIEYSGSQDIDVLAVDSKEAESIAMDSIELEFDDYESNVSNVEVINEQR